MPFAFFQIPAGDSGEQADKLNRFINSHRIVSVEKHFHANESGGVWSFCLQWADGIQAHSGKRSASKVDYKAVLSEEQFRLYSKLRDARKAISEKDGVPLYAIATNENLADIVRGRITSLTGLAQIAGFGDAKIKKYGDQLLAPVSAIFEESQNKEQIENAKTETGGSD